MQTKILLLVVLVGVVDVTSHPLGNEGKRLIKVSDADSGRWLNEEEIFQLVKDDVHFMDVTDHKFLAKPLAGVQGTTKALPTTPRYQALVRQLISTSNVTRMEAFVQHFSSYRTRYYSSPEGLASEKWLLQEISSTLQGYSGRAILTEFHHSWLQPSIVVRLEGGDPTLRDELVITGGHLDSINMYGQLRDAPGADDNAAGSVVVLEALRILVAAGFVPRRSLEFHWYAAEEVGLRGAADIAGSYFSSRANVTSFVNFDVPGYYQQGAHDIEIITDRVDPQLTQLLRTLIDEYCVYGWQDGYCGYGCSDHAAWYSAGFPAAYPGEVVWHPQMHTEQDTIEKVGFEQVNEFVKLAVAYLVEVGEPLLSTGK